MSSGGPHIAPVRKPKNPQFMDLEGQTYGRLSVAAFADSDGKHTWWWCRCECGAVIKTSTNKLRQGSTKSCGCWKRDETRRRTITHGLTGHPLFRTWTGLRGRCLTITDAAYLDYGGRGIRVCDRWLNGDGILSGFECFLADMGPKPSPQHSLDRKNGDGNYDPGNCRWATKTEQARNRRNNRLVKINGKKMSVAEACECLGLEYKIVNDRLQKGWSFDRAVKQPIRRRAA